MKQDRVIELLGRKAELKRQIKENERSIRENERRNRRLAAETVDLYSTVAEIEGVTLFEDTPVRVVEEEGVIGVSLGCSGPRRHALLSPRGDAFEVIAYRSHTDAGRALGTLPRAGALRAAKTFVATGRIPEAERRGRPRKAAATA